MEEIKGIVVNGVTYGLEDETTNETAKDALNLAENNANDITAIESSIKENDDKIILLSENMNVLNTKIETVEQTADTALAKAEEYTLPQSSFITCYLNANRVAKVTNGVLNRLLEFNIAEKDSGNRAVILVCNENVNEPYSTFFNIYNNNNLIYLQNIDNKNFEAESVTNSGINITTTIESIQQIKIVPIFFYKNNT